MSPHAVLPLFVAREASVSAVENALKTYDMADLPDRSERPGSERPMPDNLYGKAVVNRVLADAPGCPKARSRLFSKGCTGRTGLR